LADVKLHFKQAFPKNQEPDSLFQALVNLQSTGASPEYRGMNAAEAVVFWLGGFSSDARYPVSGAGGPSYVGGPGNEDLEGRNWLHTFEQSRLGPRNDSGVFAGRVLTYTGPDGPRAINLWTYTPDGFQQPYMYFDTSRYKPAEYDPISHGVVALKSPPASGAATNALQAQFANSGSFQILHAGLDDSWGDFQPLQSKLTFEAIKNNSGIIYPAGPFTEELADNLSNFSRGPLEDAEP
jgi:hypothetical protein